MDDRPRKKEVDELKSELELREALRRCGLLLKNTTLLDRMSDKGKGLRERYEALLAKAKELRLAALVSEFGGLSVTNSAAGKTEDEENDNTAAADPSTQSARVVKKEEGDEKRTVNIEGTEGEEVQKRLPPEQAEQQRYSEEEVSTYGMAMILKQRGVRGDIHKELQRMYGSNLSQREIQRLAEASSPNLLMSYDDTIEMEERFAELERQAMMRRIRDRLAAEAAAAAAAGGGNGNGNGLRTSSSSYRASVSSGVGASVGGNGSALTAADFGVGIQQQQQEQDREDEEEEAERHNNNDDDEADEDAGDVQYD